MLHTLHTAQVFFHQQDWTPSPCSQLLPIQCFAVIDIAVVNVLEPTSLCTSFINSFVNRYKWNCRVQWSACFRGSCNKLSNFQSRDIQISTSDTVVPRPTVSLSVVSGTDGPPWSENLSGQFLSFQLYAVLSSKMKSHTAPPHPALDVHHPWGQRLRAVPAAPPPHT